MVADHRPARTAPLAGARASSGAAPWPTLVVVAAGLFLAVLSTTAMSVALPSIGHDLGASATDLEWTVDAYVLVYASLLVPGGVAGDRRGRKGTFILGVALFGLGSLAAGLAPTTGLLLAARVAQGTGPALLIPGSLAIIRAAFTDDRQRAMAIGLWSTSSGIAMAAGPAVGGVIVGTLGWRWVLLLNVPLTAALVALAARVVPRLPRPGTRGPFDWPGAAASVAAVGLLAFAVIEGQDRGWTSALVVAAFAAGAGAGVAFVLAARRRSSTSRCSGDPPSPWPTSRRWPCSSPSSAPSSTSAPTSSRCRAAPPSPRASPCAPSESRMPAPPPGRAGWSGASASAGPC
jgi:MFS transporter, DHA2 family, methylenomycin A resistance protein